MKKHELPWCKRDVYGLSFYRTDKMPPQNCPLDVPVKSSLSHACLFAMYLWMAALSLTLIVTSTLKQQVHYTDPVTTGLIKCLILHWKHFLEHRGPSMGLGDGLTSKVLGAICDDLRSVPRNHLVEGKSQLPLKLSSDLHTWAMACTPPINK